MVGETPSAAVSTLNGQGLNVNQVPTTVHNPANVGLVVQQFPTSLTVVKKGSVVTIYYGVAAGSGGGQSTGGTTGAGNSNRGNSGPGNHHHHAGNHEYPVDDHHRLHHHNLNSLPDRGARRRPFVRA